MIDGKTTEQMQKEEQKLISDLCLQSLNSKWYKNSDGQILSRCPFCYDLNNCFECICPKEICRWTGFYDKYGIIGKSRAIRGIIHKYRDYKYIEEIPEEELNKIIQMFKNYIVD